MNANIVELRTKKPQKDLTAEETSFLDLVLGGMSMTDAVFESGIMNRELQNDQKKRKAASIKASYIMNTKRAQVYIAKKRKTIVIYTENDLPRLMTHIYEIAIGEAKATAVIDGEEIEVSPSFKDQINAANLFRNYANDLKKDVKSIPLKNAKKKAVDAVAIEFASKYKTREVDDGFMKGRVTSRARINNDAFIEAYSEEIDGEEAEGDSSQL